MNFLHLTTFYPPYSFGGDAMYLYRLSHALGDLGHSVDVVHCIDSYHLLHPAKPEISFEPHPRVRTHGLRSGYGWLSPLLTHQTGRPYLKEKTIRGLLDSKKYDAVHFHNISLLGPRVLSFVARRTPAVTLYTTHEHWLVCPMHVLWKFNRRACDRPDCLRCVLIGKRPPQVWRYTGLLEREARHVDQFVSPSRFTAKLHRERGFSRKVDHLPYFIERVDDDWRSPGERPSDRPYFLFVGRLEIIKGLHDLIRTWGKVSGYDLLIAGTGTYEPQLKAMAQGNPRIRFLGALSQTQLSTLYYHAIACIVPSITFETFGIVIIEAFARKTPAIVHDIGALPEVVRDSDGGFVYRTEGELLDAIRQLGGSERRRRELGENGYRAFVEHWSKEAHLKQYFGYLEQIAKNKYGQIPWAGEAPSNGNSPPLSFQSN
jgi:glycosyltransferase involved in cell wall biosynthesis